MPDLDHGSSGFDNSRVVSRATGAIGANPLVYLGLALILAGVPGYLSGWWQFDLQSAIDPENPRSAFARYFTTDFWLNACAMWGVALICGAILAAALTRATATHLAGRTPSFVQSLETGLALIVPMAVLSLIIGIGVFIGLALLIVPGVILWLYWSVALQARVQERIGTFDAFRRSAELTSGHRGNIFLIFLAIMIGLIVFGWGTRMILGGLLGTSHSQPMFALVESLMAVVSNMVILTVQASVYVELRTLKDGVAPNELAAIFA
jgi:hypothetical protein